MLTLTPGKYGGIKSIAPGFNDIFYKDLQQALTNSGYAAGITPEIAFREVGILNRGLSIIAQLVSDFPFEIMVGDKVVTDDKQYKSVLKKWKHRAALTVYTYYIKRGAYWFLSTDASGRNVTPVLLPTGDVTAYNDTTKIVGFRYSGRLLDPNTGQPIPRDIAPERMIWFWTWNDRTPLEPGDCPIQAAMANAGIVRALDLMLAAYFNRGGVPVTLFPIPPGTDPNSEKSFQNFLDRMASGIRNAFKYLAVRFDIKPIVLGQEIQKMQANELYKLQSYRVLEDIGIPPSIVNSESAHDATATADMAKLYTMLIIPLFELMAENINEKIFEAGKSEARIVGFPRRIEALQNALLEQAKAVYEASGERPMTLAEGRDILELPALPGTEKDAVQLNGAQLNSILEIAIAVGRRDISPLQGAAMLQSGFPQLPQARIVSISTPPEKEEAPAVIASPVPPSQPRPDATQEPQMDEALPGEGNQDAVTKALADWRKLILDNLKNGVPVMNAPVPISVPHKITDAISGEVISCKTASDIRAVFDKHWPKPQKVNGAPPQEVVALLARAVKLQEQAQ